MAGFSWKQGFLSNQSKGKTSTQALPQVVAKRIKEKQCPRFEKTQNESQRNFLTGEVVPYHPDPAAATDPAPSSLLNVTTAPAPNLGPCQDSKALNTTHSGTAPRTSQTHDDGHIHRASPVRGLPPERANTDDTLVITHNVQEGTPASTIEKSVPTKGPGPKNTGYVPCEQMITATSPATDQKQILVEPPLPPPPPDANDGPEAVMRVIDAWLDYQDYLDNKQALSQSHRSNTDEEYHLPPVVGEQPMEQQPNARQCQTTTTAHATHLGGQLDDPRVPRKRFSWKQGFLKAQKLPNRRPRRCLDRNLTIAQQTKDLTIYPVFCQKSVNLPTPPQNHTQRNGFICSATTYG